MSWFQGFEHIVTEKEPMAAPYVAANRRTGPVFCRTDGFGPAAGIGDAVSRRIGRAPPPGRRFQPPGSRSRNSRARIEAIERFVRHRKCRRHPTQDRRGSTAVPGDSYRCWRWTRWARRTVGNSRYRRRSNPRQCRGASADIGRSLVEATVLTRTGELITRTRDQMQFSYRESSLNELAIVDATFELEQEEIRRK